ncbi:15465_t:CDS:2 [Dentiscutata heterogama]|uniref:15465_t:CDS:1 n=1 Tax=Dentiscutata heterogama TaxID=1316150 RepID=A0ACA9K6Q5_9GLOM|nr:15465_t:CDS:2 [Dentiscutata heterogama]
MDLIKKDCGPCKKRGKPIEKIETKLQLYDLKKEVEHLKKANNGQEQIQNDMKKKRIKILIQEYYILSSDLIQAIHNSLISIPEIDET